MFTLAEIRISGKLLKSILCLALTLSPLALTAQNNNQYAYVSHRRFRTGLRLPA